MSVGRFFFRHCTFCWSFICSFPKLIVKPELALHSFQANFASWKKLSGEKAKQGRKWSALIAGGLAKKKAAATTVATNYSDKSKSDANDVDGASQRCELTKVADQPYSSLFC